ncbi:alanine racemase [Undibacterium arcticum]|uniref:Alanine racemase n=1 Tax=Undibacterium arcticum TaxID=1762892 RepID=A0ABV7F4H7_9BURK
MPRPLVATIDIAAMQHNLAVAKARTPRAKVWAIVKANAYGHGLARGVRGFAAADGMGLIELDAAVRLRDLGWTKPILLLEGFFAPEDLAIVSRNQLEVAVHCDEQIAMIEHSGITTPLDVHLKMNSGMNRLGFTPDRFGAAYVRLRAIPTVRKITLMTHFANADDVRNPSLLLSEQVRRFQDGIAGLSGELSLSNSAATLLHPELVTDWVRPGVMLYGGTPGGKTAQEFGLLPTMTLTSEIIGTQDIATGDAVGYGSRFVADKPMKIGVVACGYADGYPRHAPDGTPIIVDGVRTAMVGRVSMDMITVDLTPVPGAHVGSAVTLWGDGVPIDEVAQAAGTIGYELMCAVAPRVQMVER